MDEEAEIARGYCLAVRAAVTDDGRTPLEATGLQLHDRLTKIGDPLTRVQEKRGSARRFNACSDCCAVG